MKILFVSPYFPPHIGGAENYVNQIARGLHSIYGWETVIVTSQSETKKVLKEKHDGMTFYRLPTFCTLSNTPLHPWWYFTMKKIIRDERPDGINAHSPVPFMADLSSWCAGTIPFILTYHTGPMARKGEWFKDLLIRWYERYILPSMLRNATLLISTSTYVRQSVFPTYATKTITITPGVDTHLFRQGNPIAGANLLFVGNLNKTEYYKRLDVLLQAIPIIKKKIKAISLTVVGDGDMLPNYKELCKQLHIEEQVHFKGSLVADAIRREYRQAALFVHPSQFDSFPLVLLEAAASGLPVVSTTVGGIAEIIQHGKNGFLVPPRDVSALARSIMAILSQPTIAQKMSMTQRDTARKHYDWKKKIAATKTALEQVIVTQQI